jgi:anti-sigma regulatory factor (Ser/Thr protein kinase)
VNQESLSHQSTQRLVPFKANQIAGEPVVLDLRNIAWVEPFGLVFLELYVRRLLSMDPASVEVKLPGGSIGTYVRGMHVDRRLGEIARVAVKPPWPLGIRLGGSSRHKLLELARHRLSDDTETERVALKLLDVVVHERRREFKHLTSRLQEALTEILDNVEVHSRVRREEPAEAVVAAQTYRGRVVLAIGDRGIGIPARLRGHSGVSKEMDDVHVLEKAVEPGISSRIDRGGYGLYVLSEQVQQSGGYLAIRSGTGHLEVHQGGEKTRRGSCHPVPGTIVEFAIPIES